MSTETATVPESDTESKSSKPPKKPRTLGKMPRNALPPGAIHPVGATPGGADLPRAGDGELWDIPLDSIDIPIETRPVNEQHVEQLMRSIQDVGLQSPVTVYHSGNELDPRFTLGPGRHRLEAHRRLGLPTIRAIVKGPATDQEIRFAQAIENLHRKDLTPIEEAEMCEVVLEATPGAGLGDGERLELAAARIGCDRKWLERRLALTRLSPRVKQMLLDGEIFLSHAELLARLVSHERQEEIAGRYAGGQGYRNDSPPEAMRRWKDAVESELRTLHGVTWKLDVEFAGKPACSACPHNTANAPGLFDGDAPKKAQCLNAACYTEKSKAASRAVIRASNTLVKPADVSVSAKPTISARTAAAAADARDASFVEPKVIMQRARQLVAEPSKNGKPTKAERRGRAQGEYDWERDHGIHKLQREMKTKWWEPIAKQIHERSFDPWARMVIHFLLEQGWHFRQGANNKRDKLCREAAKELLDTLVPHGNAVNGVAATFAEQFCRVTDDHHQKGWWLPDINTEPGLISVLCQWLKVPIESPCPTNEDAAKAYDAKHAPKKEQEPKGKASSPKRAKKQRKEKAAKE